MTFMTLSYDFYELTLKNTCSSISITENETEQHL